jgi:hypothetical protein
VSQLGNLLKICAYLIVTLLDKSLMSFQFALELSELISFIGGHGRLTFF